ncbi:hypothetical protein MHYP_G00022010 [Metynnis hypsauchen]
MRRNAKFCRAVTKKEPALECMLWTWEGLRQQMGCPAVCLIEMLELERTPNTVPSFCQHQQSKLCLILRELCCQEPFG